ncbi:unnamed protein product [Owenia fusiformis]|uniref:Amine oxidase n=1 Tax=Owenia fusiformis TaxID=6347 RepID=A0A8S4PHB2_OWEFU|nr:unnamed protein product [Owenia fusiformis]
MMKRRFLIIFLAHVLNIGLSDRNICLEDVNITPGTSSSTFGELTTSEIDEVIRYIGKELNAVPSTTATVSDTFAYVIEKKPTRKEDALNHVDHDGPVPTREASVVLVSPEEVAEYTVGPLPNPTYHFRTEKPKWRRSDLRFIDRPFYTPADFVAVDTLMQKEGLKLKLLMQESFNGYDMGYDCLKDCITFSLVRTNVFQKNRFMWVYFKRKFDISLGLDRLYPLPLQMLLNVTDRDPSKWNTIQIWYNDQFFDSIDDLITKYNNDTITKVKVQSSIADMFSSSLRRREDEFSESSRKRGPDCFPQDGRRYSIDGRRIKYMNWEFEFTNRQSTGPQLFDIRFRKERIVYELSLQEILLLYSGNNPVSRDANVVLDSEIVNGHFISPMAPGVDCPKGSSYFNSTIYNYHYGTSTVIPNAFCIFEDIDGPPLKRHYEYTLDGSYAFYAGMPNNALVLRTMQTIDNYDYIYDFIFYQNGVLGTKIAASGYVATEPTTNKKRAKQDQYGFQLNHNVLAMLHQHLFNFKVDMDTKGRTNRHETLAVKVRPTTLNVGNNIRDETYEQYLKTNAKSTEKQARYRFKYSQPKYYTFYNKVASQSKLKYNKAYYLDNQGSSKFLFPDKWSKMGSVAWAKYQLAVTRHHDDEDTSSTIYNSFDQLDPVLNFDSYISDNENITDKDLVAWVTVGMQHLPTPANDIPVTMTAGNSLSFYLKPFHYFDEDPSMTSHDNVFITPGRNGKENITENENNAKKNCCPPKDNIRFDSPII